MRYIHLFGHKSYLIGTSLLFKYRLSLVYHHRSIEKIPEAATSKLEMSVKLTDLSQATRPSSPEDFVGGAFWAQAARSRMLLSANDLAP
jgi:hypothetical protein